MPGRKNKLGYEYDIKSAYVEFRTYPCQGTARTSGRGISDQIPPKKRLIAWRMRSLRVTDLVGVPYLKALSKTMPSLTLLLSL